MPIYTKTGDNGETGLIGGARIPKADLRICAIGEVDELNASIGVLRSFGSNEKAENLLEKIQHDLFAVGAELADARPDAKKRITEDHVRDLEAAIDEREKILPRLRNFILPEGDHFTAHAHQARAICRRAERALASFNQAQNVNPHVLAYINRLSDLLFILAREEMHEKKIPETVWKT